MMATRTSRSRDESRDSKSGKSGRRTVFIRVPETNASWTICITNGYETQTVLRIPSPKERVVGRRTVKNRRSAEVRSRKRSCPAVAECSQWKRTTVNVLRVAPTEARVLKLGSRWRLAVGRRVQITDRYLVDPASSHMLVSKIKPCMSKLIPLHGEAANGSLGHP